jgi:hypothetical protein
MMPEMLAKVRMFAWANGVKKLGAAIEKKIKNNRKLMSATTSGTLYRPDRTLVVKAACACKGLLLEFLYADDNIS